MKELIRIQNELKAPKGQYNSFGKYSYRSCEDILEAVKPLLSSYDCILTLSDEITLVGERYYVKATAILMNGASEKVEVTAYAREEEDKKGMDGSQITGAASSYARKYALNGLFCIDDTKDSDTTKTEAKSKKSVQAKAEATHTNADLELALQEMKEAKTVEGLQGVWIRWRAFQSNAEFMKLKDAKKKELAV
jgi:hypothetical protein